MQREWQAQCGALTAVRRFSATLSAAPETADYNVGRPTYERPQQVTAAALWKCGATLAAAPQEEIGKRCVAVLKRYGAALN